MAERRPVILYGNLLTAATAIGRSSSEDSAATIYSMLDPLPTRKWRSKTGVWTVTSGSRDELFWKRGGIQFSTILTPGTYATPQAYATMVGDRMSATDTGAIYTVSYDSTTRQFTIASSVGPLELQVTVPIISSRSAYGDLGFTSARVGANSYVGDLAVYQSAAWLAWDLGSPKNFNAAVVYAHNLGGGGTVSFLASATGNVWTAIGRSAGGAMQGDESKRIDFFTGQSMTYRYVGFEVDGTTSPDGWVEVGHAFVGGEWEPSRSYRQGMAQQPVFLGNLLRTVEGGMSRGARKIPLQFDVTFPRLTRGDLEAFYLMLKEVQDEHVYLALDPLNFPATRTYYGMITGVDPIPETVGDGDPPDRYTISFTFEEAPAS